MKVGDTYSLKSRYSERKKRNMVLDIIKSVSRDNSIRIQVNSTGGFPAHPEKKERPFLSFKFRKSK